MSPAPLYRQRFELPIVQYNAVHSGSRIICVFTIANHVNGIEKACRDEATQPKNWACNTSTDASFKVPLASCNRPRMNVQIRLGV